MDKDNIIYNLIVLLSESREENISDKHFINYTCEQAYLPESEYRRILKDLLEDE